MENTSFHVKNKAVRKGDFCLNFPLPTALNTSVYESCFSLFRDFSPSRLSLRILLFHCHRLRQIPWLIHIQALCHTDIISHQLQRHDCQAGSKVLVCLRHIYGEICRVFNVIVSILGQSHEISATALYLYHVAHCLLKQRFLSGHAYNQSSVFDKADGAVF